MVLELGESLVRDVLGGHGGLLLVRVLVLPRHSGRVLWRRAAAQLMWISR